MSYVLTENNVIKFSKLKIVKMVAPAHKYFLLDETGKEVEELPSNSDDIIWYSVRDADDDYELEVFRDLDEALSYVKNNTINQTEG